MDFIIKVKQVPAEVEFDCKGCVFRKAQYLGACPETPDKPYLQCESHSKSTVFVFDNE